MTTSVSAWFPKSPSLLLKSCGRYAGSGPGKGAGDCDPAQRAQATIRRRQRENRRSKDIRLRGRSLPRRDKRSATKIRRRSRCAENFLFNGPPIDEFVADMITESWSLRDANRALRGDGNFRFDDVFNPITLAG